MINSHIHTCNAVTPLLHSHQLLCQICGFSGFRTETQNASAEFSSSNDIDNVKCGWGSKNSIPLMAQNASCRSICLRPADVFYMIQEVLSTLTVSFKKNNTDSNLYPSVLGTSSHLVDILKVSTCRALQRHRGYLGYPWQYREMKVWGGVVQESNLERNKLKSYRLFSITQMVLNLNFKLISDNFL